jgi:uncharacterized RDD family membrane protein YckC
MTTADDYVNSVLDRMPRAMPRRSHIGAELRSHIAERIATGHPLDDVLRQLGDPVALAESYLAEVPLVPAPLGRRIAAKLVDVLLFLLMFALVIVTAFVMTRAFDADAWLWIAVMLGIIGLSIMFVIYMVWTEWQYGQTLGKRLFDLRVVRESGARIGLGQSVVRQLPSIFQVFWIDALFALFTDKRQRAFELLSKTRVVDAKAEE